eukprot:TRINITY_DN15636_c0_g1_i1.p1 TRINITY_DN15636_c0_g1~~TRINITY_DN15636_c0_g1_i1.p1  ORF type:complete len:335 (+),score=87.99 TRINITY_DN15636_c0_g1_i1:146-1150(+)
MSEDTNDNNNNKRARECEEDNEQTTTSNKKTTPLLNSTTATCSLSTPTKEQHTQRPFILIEDDVPPPTESKPNTNTTTQNQSSSFPYFVDKEEEEEEVLLICSVCKLSTNTAEYPLYICDSSGCNNSFHFDCAHYPRALQICEYTYSLCAECKLNTGLSNDDIYQFEEEYFEFQWFARSNDMEFIDIENDGKCIFSAVFGWMPTTMRQSLYINTIDELISRSVESLLCMIGSNEIPIVKENQEDLVMDLSLVASDSSLLCDIWNKHYDSGLGIGDYFISSIERCLSVGIRVSQYLDSQVLIRQQSHQFENEINVVIRAEKFAAHYDLLLPVKPK